MTGLLTGLLLLASSAPTSAGNAAEATQSTIVGGVIDQNGEGVPGVVGMAEKITWNPKLDPEPGVVYEYAVTRVWRSVTTAEPAFREWPPEEHSASCRSSLWSIGKTEAGNLLIRSALPIGGCPTETSDPLALELVGKQVTGVFGPRGEWMGLLERDEIVSTILESIDLPPAEENPYADEAAQLMLESGIDFEPPAMLLELPAKTLSPGDEWRVVERSQSLGVDNGVAEWRYVVEGFERAGSGTCLRVQGELAELTVERGKTLRELSALIEPPDRDPLPSFEVAESKGSKSLCLDRRTGMAVEGETELEAVLVVEWILGDGTSEEGRLEVSSRLSLRESFHLASAP